MSASSPEPRVPSALRRRLAAVRRVYSRIARPLRVILLLAIIAFAVYALASSWDSVASALADMGVWRILLSVVVLVASIAGHYVSWLAVLAALGAPRMPVAASAAISTTSQIAKYLPGSVWTAVVQADLGRRHGIAPRVMFASYGLVLLLSVATGSVLSLLVLVGPVPPWIAWIAVCAAVCGLLVWGAVLHPRLGSSRAGRLLRRVVGESLPERVDRRAVVVAIVAVAVAWTLAGVQSWILAEPLGATAGDLVFVTGAIVLSWVVGLVIVVVPAGAGVREVLLVLTVGQVVGGAGALTIAVLTRFLQIAVELGLAAIFGLPYVSRVMSDRRRGSASSGDPDPGRESPADQ